MRSARLCAALCLVLSVSCYKHGCLFEKKLCVPDQICSDDGLFGQCHSPAQNPVQYQVSVPLLHRLQQVLKELMEQVPKPEPRSPADPDEQLIQQFVDYMILDPAQSSVRGPLVDPYTYKQQQFGFQDEEERSLNSLDQNPVFNRPKSQSGSSLDQDQQLFQDLVSYFLDSPSSPSSSHTGALSSSSLPVQPLSHHTGALSSGPAFFPDSDFPLDYGQDFVSQQQNKKQQKQFKALGGIGDGSVQSLASLLDHISESDRQDQPSSLQTAQYGLLLPRPPQRSMCHKNEILSLLLSTCERVADTYGNTAGSGKKFTEGSMSYKPGLSSSKSSEAPESNQNRDNINKSVEPALKFKPNSQNLTTADKAVVEKTFAESDTRLKMLNDGEVHVGKALPLATPVQPRSRWAFATLVVMACVGSVLVAAMTIACLRHHAHRLAAKKLGLGPEAGLSPTRSIRTCVVSTWRLKERSVRLEAAALGAVGGASGGGGGARAVGGAYGGGGAVGGADSRVSSVSSQFSEGAQPSPSSHSSTPSWCEEPAQANMDISTGHMILAYMEDHLRNKDRLQEWQALCSYQAEPSAMATAQSDANARRTAAPTRCPMVWENGCTVIVMLSALVEDGEKQCDRYWPDEGSSLYHIYEFHFLSWPAQGIPTSTRPLLDFRRKVNKCYRGRSCPIIVHCSDGTGRTGTYVLIDMVLNRMAKGVKEIDIAATLEHVRDQRPGMVRTKDQFEFALTAVAEEVNAILKALPQPKHSRYVALTLGDQRIPLKLLSQSQRWRPLCLSFPGPRRRRDSFLLQKVDNGVLRAIPIESFRLSLVAGRQVSPWLTGSVCAAGAPLLVMSGALQRQVELLFKQLKRKDAEIQDYRENGAQLTRERLQTEPFEEEVFRQDFMTKTLPLLVDHQDSSKKKRRKRGRSRRKRRRRHRRSSRKKLSRVKRGENTNSSEKDYTTIMQQSASSATERPASKPKKKKVGLFR
ncbi:hypothetical protein WMY93_031597 [Mugilogobius chulae]|uniref:Uncharacterized protein n=1 Tax=Mugilogobius chulae TaxID=88201 RepID=A0AAW0MHI3_9GOBI